MRVFFLYLLSFFAPLALWAETTVLVSISPQKYLVERIAGHTLKVVVIVPPGASPHSYEPTPYQTVKIQEGTIWFRMGEGFEHRLLPLLKQTKIVDQREGIPLLSGSCCCHHDISSFDIHFWLSPKLLKKMASQIEANLSTAFPENAKQYKANLATLNFDLERLDLEVGQLLAPMKNRSVLVSHPAFGYLCAEYQIIQLPIEMEGREPTPKYLSEIFQRAKQEGIRTVFLQKQYNIKGGEALARELDAKTVFLDPYAENVIENIRKIAEAFSRS